MAASPVESVGAPSTQSGGDESAAAAAAAAEELRAMGVSERMIAMAQAHTGWRTQVLHTHEAGSPTQQHLGG